MNILSAEGLSMSYSEKILFDGISIGIDEGDRIGLIGINGTGKSTLLKVIAGVEQPDGGRIISVNGLRVEYLPQNLYFEEGTTVLQQVFKGNSPVMKLLREYEEVLAKAQENAGYKQLEKELIALSQKMDGMDAWTMESEAKTVLTRLGILDFNADVSKLSGGQRKRVAMAGALITPSDLLILDEPTNHIDNDTVDWLEKYLNSRKGALLMVTHDRYFLDRLANRIVELDRGKLYTYQGNYEKYLEMKAEREELEQASERKRQNLMRQELEWIRRGARARSTKQKARIERFEKLREEEAPAEYGSVEISTGSARLGKKIIELEDIKKSYPGIRLIDGLSYILLRNDRIGIIGPNGSGKSTLLKIIAGRLEADSGNIVTGATVKIGFFTQEGFEMDESLRVIEYIREEAEFLTTDEGTVSASQMLERFLFPTDVQWTPIAKLSGGERRRLYLLRILMSEPNVLLLDEPTNDLDIKTLTILENYIEGFKGAVIAVSHDRYFLDRIAGKIFSFEGGGTIKQYNGNYSDYTEAVRSAEPVSRETGQNTGEGRERYSQEKAKEKPLKFTFKEQKEFEEIDGLVAGLEEELKELEIKINEASSDFESLQELLSKKELVEEQLNTAIERWAYLNELAEKIQKNKNG